MNSINNTYDTSFMAGVEAAVTLGRAGVSPDDLALLLQKDPGQADRRQYTDHLETLRRILGTDFGDIEGGS